MAAPVVVVGGGPVGMVTALLLARAGVASVVCEAAPRRETVGSRSICMQRDVLDILQRCGGVGEEVAAAGVTWSTGRIYYREHEVVTITFEPRPAAAFPPFTNLGQSIVERMLDARVAVAPLIDMRWGVRIAGLTQDADGVTVIAEDGTRLRGRYCVAADGARSTVRGLLGLPFEGHSFDDQFLIADIRAALPFAAERRFFFDPAWNPGRQVLVHPQPDDVWRIDWQVPVDFDLDHERASGGLDARIRRVVGNTPYEPVWVSAYRFHQRRVPHLTAGRVLLAGDAAHLMSPFGARGLNSGIQDAENAAWKLAHTLSGEGGPNLLASYDVERGAAAAENLAVTGETMRFLVPRTEADRAYRADVLARSVHDPSARALINSGRLAAPFSYGGSPLTTAGCDGALCPDEMLPSGERLRPLFGPSFTVLAAASDTSGTWASRGSPDESWDAGVPGSARLPGPALASTRVVSVGVDSEVGVDRAGVTLVRPDGHLAAVLPDAKGLGAALARATGW